MLSIVCPSMAVCSWTESSSRYATNKIHCIVKFLFGECISEPEA